MEIVLIAALSLDGRLTRHETPGVAFASAEDQVFLRQRLRECDASIMGAGTYRLHREAILAKTPAKRLRLIWTRTPEAFQSDAKPGSLEFSAETPVALVERLRSLGVRRVALLGGPQVYSAFLEANLVDELWLTYEPEVVGTGLPLAQLPLGSRWERAQTRALNADTLAIRYRRPGTSPVGILRRAGRRRLALHFTAWVAGLIGAGAVLGTILFPTFGPLFGSVKSTAALALAGAKFGSFYCLIWAPGIAIVATVMRAHKKAGPRLATPRS
ncbi:dihydrofolate reductase family protein [Nibricoccus sp. IMCC34717]|uniref:dihydrofolate reductase family protein n=1 Tax=Nibricoccus sp. IMCC34717 TaxID=3034021 RepID=UPI00384EDA3C